VDHHKPVVYFNNLPIELRRYELITWIRDVVKGHDYVISELSFNFVSREKIEEINKTYLNHSYSTDIITFDYSENKHLSGEVYICPDVVRENAVDYDIAFVQELKRVIIHGVLHLVGYKDSTAEERMVMRAREDASLSLLDSDENEV
jgi:rRNA maturation RNase YbeY